MRSDAEIVERPVEGGVLDVALPCAGKSVTVRADDHRGFAGPRGARDGGGPRGVLSERHLRGGCSSGIARDMQLATSLNLVR